MLPISLGKGAELGSGQRSRQPLFIQLLRLFFTQLLLFEQVCSLPNSNTGCIQWSKDLTADWSDTVTCEIYTTSRFLIVEIFGSETKYTERFTVFYNPPTSKSSFLPYNSTFLTLLIDFPSNLCVVRSIKYMSIFFSYFSNNYSQRKQEIKLPQAHSRIGNTLPWAPEEASREEGKDPLCETVKKLQKVVLLTKATKNHKGSGRSN